jgi:hypothetical protein
VRGTRVVAAGMLLLAPTAFALDGDRRVHGPSTVVRCDGRFVSLEADAGRPGQ